MFKAFSGALSLLLAILVLRMALPEVFAPFVEVVVKLLELVSSGLDQAQSGLPR